MSRISGSLQSATIDGVPYDVMSDTNVSISLNEFENDSIPSSGKPIHKKMKRVAAAESIVLGTSWEEKETLINLANSVDTLTFSLKFAGGDVIKGEGHINIDSDESEENRTTVKFMPDGGWNIFAA